MPWRIDDPVRRLWAQAIAAKTEAELTAILPQLHAAIRERIRRLRLMAAKEIRASGTDRRAA
ncbi:MAG: hypothetical protein DMG61_13335 [Acidobacteria bacterium]|nr:MAG: hypothetical protein DMG61_13335 [Acidobacteriota bacterium]